MYHNNDFIYEAVGNLESNINLPIDIETTRDKYDAILNIQNIQFLVIAKAAMRASNQGIILSQLNEIINTSSRPILFVADYISKDGASQLKKRGFNYLDTAGNAFIRKDDLIIYVDGQKRTLKDKTNQSRAFQEAGVKIIFHLLSETANLQNSYRTIAQKVEVSLGSVSNVMAELEDLNYLIKTKEKRVLKNKEELLERWLQSYNETLKPRILRKRMCFLDKDVENNWRALNLNFASIYDDNEIKKQPGHTVWGGEPGASIITGSLRPEVFTLFTNYEIHLIASRLKLIPDPDGNVFVYNKFWNDNFGSNNVAPKLLIYADLINSGYGRNIEIANEIFENEL